MKSTHRWLLALFVMLMFHTALMADASPSLGDLPKDRSGKTLNLDFEKGSLEDWTAQGDAFTDAVIHGDAVAKRRGDMTSQHQGEFWVGSYERSGDAPTGTLTSATFVVDRPWASFLLAGGSHEKTRLELVRADTGKVFFEARGDETETLKRVGVDLTKVHSVPIFIRLVDEDSTGWGHVNFDDFRLHDQKPVNARPAQLAAPDRYAHEGLSPQDAARAMTVPEGFQVTLFAGEPDVVQPIAMATDDRGRVWVAEAYSYPHRVAPEDAKDRILIFEDTDNDGTFDRRTVFAEKLNLVSGLEIGYGGVWVGAAPELLFIPDANQDDRPDGPPQVVLDGWGQHDTHETLNSFAWGPDGWLYGCHGVFTHSNVGKPGSDDSSRTPINAGIWRYHPRKQIFEVFAHGTSNPWGVDWNENGQAFLTSCVIPHLYHIIQGGRYERQAGSHFNIYTYDDIKTIADHRHYVGDNPHRGNGRSDSMGGGHAHAGAMIYNGVVWPETYRGSIFMNNIHGARLNRDVFRKLGSGFVGSHETDFLFANDSWSQIVSLKQGPGETMYLVDWYDKNQCHRVEDGAHDRTNGRLFKVTYGKAGKAPVDLSKLSSESLAAKVESLELWEARHARRILAERGQMIGAAREKLHAAAFRPSPTDETVSRPRYANPSLTALWALQGATGLNEEEVSLGLSHPDPYMRAWTIQFAMEDRKPSQATLEKFAKMASSDPSPVVRLYLASALQRMPPASRWDILRGLVSHAEDADDPNLPLMEWFAAEPLAEIDPSRALELASGAKLPRLLPFMSRRIAAIGTDSAIAVLVNSLEAQSSTSAKASILDGLMEGLKGRRRVAMPESWARISRVLANDADAGIRDRAKSVGVTFGDEVALREMRERLQSEQMDRAQRLEALETLLRVRDPKLSPVLQKIVTTPFGQDASAEARALVAPAIRGLAAYDDSRTAQTLLSVYPSLSTSEKRDALNTLASRSQYATTLLQAVKAKTIPSSDLSADLVRQLRNLKNDEIVSLIGEVWGTVRDADTDKVQLIDKYRKVVRAGYTQAPDPMLGRAVFSKTCSQCHTLFGTGGKVGPELTGSNRADLDYVLSNVLDPNALIGKDYTAHIIGTTDGRVLTGMIQSEDTNAITLVTANETLTVPKNEIEERKISDKSMMPDDLWAALNDHEVRSIVAYLASPSQVPLLATSETAATFFNGKDLTGWKGDTTLWSVQEGEIVGRTQGLDHNEFLTSDLAAENFHLSFDVKLEKNEGNSGVQFRSEALPDGEMKGYQADIGAGWWGKLYEENGRALLWDKSGEAFVKPGEWNHYEIVADGSKIVTKINGQTCVDLNDPEGARRGIFGLQLHSGGPTTVRYKILQLQVLSR